MIQFYYSQCGEDRWLLQHYPELATRKGEFVEVGAYDGIESSNTMAFEGLGWTGVCFEPSPKSYDLLKKTRPNCANHAIGTVEGFQTFYDGGGRGSHGMIPNDHNRNHTIEVPVYSLETSADAWMDHIDLLSIDTEGTELDVWASRGHFHPEFVICEYDTYGKINFDVIPRFEADGYELIHTTPYNHIFRAK